MVFKKERGFAHLLLIVVILLMGVITIGFFAKSSSEKPNKIGFGNSDESLTPIEAGKN